MISGLTFKSLTHFEFIFVASEILKAYVKVERLTLPIWRPIKKATTTKIAFLCQDKQVEQWHVIESRNKFSNI